MTSGHVTHYPDWMREPFDPFDARMSPEQYRQFVLRAHGRRELDDYEAVRLLFNAGLRGAALRLR